MPTPRGTVTLDVEAFRAKRRAHFDTQLAFAQASGYSLSIVSGWERGKRQPSPRAIAAVAATLGVEPSEITTITEAA